MEFGEATEQPSESTKSLEKKKDAVISAWWLGRFSKRRVFLWCKSVRGGSICPWDLTPEKESHELLLRHKARELRKARNLAKVRITCISMMNACLAICSCGGGFLSSPMPDCWLGVWIGIGGSSFYVLTLTLRWKLWNTFTTAYSISSRNWNLLPIPILTMIQTRWLLTVTCFYISITWSVFARVYLQKHVATYINMVATSVHAHNQANHSTE